MEFKAGSDKVQKVWTGLCDVTVIAVNPTIADLEKIGITWIKKEPEYTTKSEEGKDKTRIDFWVKNEEIDLITKLSIFTENKIAVSQSGNMRFINDLGQSTWAKSIEDLRTNERMKWFDTKTAVPAIEGQVEIIEFVKAWVSVPRNTVIKVNDMVQITKGNMAELKPLIANYGNRKVQVLLYEKNGYQSVYSRQFGRAGAINPKNIEFWKKNLEQANINYQGTLVLKAYELSDTGASSTEESAETDVWK